LVKDGECRPHARPRQPERIPPTRRNLRGVPKFTGSLPHFRPRGQKGWTNPCPRGILPLSGHSSAVIKVKVRAASTRTLKVFGKFVRGTSGWHRRPICLPMVAGGFAWLAPHERWPAHSPAGAFGEASAAERACCGPA
jgi:hypothetical protein